jgi:hypothetical protein
LFLQKAGSYSRAFVERMANDCGATGWPDQCDKFLSAVGAVIHEAVPKSALRAYAKADNLSGESPSIGRLHCGRFGESRASPVQPEGRKHHGQERRKPP